MRGHHRILSSLPRQCTRIKALRSFTSTSRVALSPVTEGEEEEQREGNSGRYAPRKDPTFADWKATIGKQYENPHRPCNWLGGKVPFPLNPSFKPPTPVSDALRNVIYKSFMANPQVNTVRDLAGRYHLSIKRVDAILRLKGLEESWTKGKPLQTAFLKGMEQILGVTYDARKYKTHEHWVESRMHTIEADALDQVEGDNKARTRYQRMFWEPVVEGQEPVLPAALKKAREDAERHGRSEYSGDVALGLTSDGGTKVTSTSDGVGRPAIHFVDVGAKFMDPKDHMRRMREGQRRARVRSSKRVPTRQPVAA